MNNEDKLKAALQNDAALRDAIRLDEMEAPKMPSDLNARLMKRMAAEAPTASRTRKLWPWIAAACAVAFIAVIATPPKSDTQATEMVAKVDPATQPVAPAAEQSAVVAPAAVTPAIVAKASPKVSKAIQKAPKTAAPAKPEAIEPAVEHVLAAATTAQSAVVEEKMVVMSERDIPITRPENYKYTPEELAQLKKQAAEAYLKWVELEMEISRNNMQTAEAK
ncbi:MAG: hypothetical protein E7102_10935 [Prevotella ruminicola]|jgi:hypothetical protein|uniref:Uncharacterized protein n=1 Tax=Xylanibacter ruminicola TaxID=839 RepID=A0A928GJE0_XYLRU|nr:hypothetical protein [Xylanibacter ruminicola]